MNILKNPILWVTVLLQLAGPFYFGFANWTNVLQYVEAFGVGFGIYEYFKKHRKDIQHLKEQIAHLHDKYDRAMEEKRHE